ncbi:MAG: helix-turn-helix domain-containing protein [Chlamydiae bacterium]|nr:helix-turn-helix domain-containing protein [Chlamydiota bacterium]
MNEDVKRVGVLFKAKRKDRNLSLKEVENSTSIRTGYIEAIEEGTIYQQVSGVYAVGFMKQYANFLGMDFDVMARESPQAFKIPQEKYDFDYGIGTLEVRGSAGGGVRWLPSLFWAMTAAIVLGLAWMLAKYLGVI